VSLAGTGSVSSNPAGISCGADCSESYTGGTPVTLTATAGTNYTFSGWSGSGISCNTTDPCTVSMTAARAVTATFSQNGAASYTLNVTLAGNGSVTSDPPGIDCGTDCSESYDSGTAVTLTATAATDYTFSGWSGSGVSCGGTDPCVVNMTAARSVVATFVSQTASGDLCDSLVTDKAEHPMTALAKPAKGQTVIDPQFGTTIRRITDVVADGGGSDGVIKPAYSTIPAWNADESYLILYHRTNNDSGHHLYNGKFPYQHLRQLDINPPDLEQFYWHATDPNVLFYVDRGTNTLMRYHVSTDPSEPVHNFANICPSATEDIDGGTDPMYMSWDSDVIGLSCTSGFAFSYKISTDTVGQTLSTPVSTAPVAAASGTLMFFANRNASNQVVAEVRDFDMNLVRNLDIDNPLDHASLGRLANGHDTHNAVSFGGNYIGSLVTTDMTDGSARVIVGPATGYPYPPSSTHVSALAFKKPGWVAASIIGFQADGQAVLDNELVLADTNPGGRVCRVAHHRSCMNDCPRDYWAEPHVVISPSGTRLLFGSDWGGGESVDAYVVELPSYKP
jgi:hypothetical protein